MPLHSIWSGEASWSRVRDRARQTDAYIYKQKKTTHYSYTVVARFDDAEILQFTDLKCALSTDVHSINLFITYSTETENRSKEIPCGTNWINDIYVYSNDYRFHCESNVQRNWKSKKKTRLIASKNQNKKKTNAKKWEKNCKQAVIHCYLFCPFNWLANWGRQPKDFLQWRKWWQKKTRYWQRSCFVSICFLSP